MMCQSYCWIWDVDQASVARASASRDTRGWCASAADDMLHCIVMAFQTSDLTLQLSAHMKLHTSHLHFQCLDAIDTTLFLCSTRHPALCIFDVWACRYALQQKVILLQGLDISPDMLDVAQEREVEGDLCVHDLGHGLPLRPGTFDGAISISAVQWLCNAVSLWQAMHRLL